MRRTHSFLFIATLLALFILAAPRINAQSGGSGLSFLKIGVGARSMGMGDAGVADADMGSAMYYNPALIADDDAASVTIMHNEWIEDISTEFVGVSVPLNGWSFGVHMGLTSVGGIELRDVPGEPIGETDTRNFAGGVTAAFAIADGVDVGATAKYVFEKIHVDEAGGYAFDFGVAVRPFSEGALANLRTGITLANIGSMTELRTVSTKLPSLLRYGASYRVPMESVKGGLNVAAEGLTLLEESTTHINLGAELDYLGMVFLRLGYRSGYDNNGISFGGGAKYSSLRFDYAFTPFSESFGNAHTISLSITL
ncbi:MAG: PorV/PorQ family protein [Bacteroidetes bacterium]|nr:PorV/PorQ family protein [Bacteroidota bacterium]